MTPWWFWLAYSIVAICSAWCTFVFMAIRRPKNIPCPNCGLYVRAATLQLHWKECEL